MQAQHSSSQRKTTTITTTTAMRAAAAVCMVLLLLLTEQGNAVPLVPVARTGSGGGGGAEALRAQGGAHVLRRTARMSPLWRVMNSKPFGAYCQNNYECSTGLCRAGQCCYNSQSEAVNN